MEAMRQSWSDDRLDTLNEMVDRRFDEVDRRFESADREVQRGFTEIHRRIDETNERLDVLQSELRKGVAERLDSIQRSMAFLAVGLTTGMLAGFAGMATAVAAVV
jgi:tetrahydromethanopterin S-methyltransferase subunit G